MIRRLTLKNWRSYAYATVEFDPGTTFVVAPNGVGKTSLIEAARYALFGAQPLDAGAAVRVGADTAYATVELELPNSSIVTVERSLARKARRATAPVVHFNGQQIPSGELDQRLAQIYRADLAFLGRLTMPATDQTKDALAALDLEGHLGQYFGVDSLRNGIGKLEGLRKATEAEIKRIKETSTADSMRVAELQRDADHAEVVAERAAEHHGTLQNRLEQAQKRERPDLLAQKWQADHAAWSEAAKALAEEHLSDTDRVITTENLDDVLEERAASLSRAIEEARVALAINRTKEEALSANDERLAAAHEDCPICRRPLDEATLDRAHVANTSEIASLRASTQQFEATETDLVAQLKRISAARSKWRRVPWPGVRPETPPALDEEASSLSELEQQTRAALDDLVEARAKHKHAASTLASALEANESMRQLELLFGRQAKLSVAIEATSKTLADLLEKTIHPLANEVSQRWEGLFPRRGSLDTRADGSITRGMDGFPLPHTSFSTGERMGATILLRLLVTQMVTTADFCWFDEPLEHFDPEVRRRMANLLSQATFGGNQLRQVVVTTYEEPLARRLHARDDERVQIIDVRQPS